MIIMIRVFLGGRGALNLRPLRPPVASRGFGEFTQGESGHCRFFFGRSDRNTVMMISLLRKTVILVLGYN
jgi:hypothetical protein